MNPTNEPRRQAALLERGASWLRMALIAAILLIFFRFLQAQGIANLWPSQPVAESTDSWPGISQPPVRAGFLVQLPDDAEVVGVCVGEHARAYLLSTMGASPDRHVVNDLLGDCPISVTYCGLTRCARVFTSERKGTILNLGVGDLSGGSMTLKVGNVLYAHQTGQNLSSPGGAPLPYPEHSYERTTWKKWRTAHPDTDIFAGESLSG